MRRARRGDRDRIGAGTGTGTGDGDDSRVIVAIDLSTAQSGRGQQAPEQQYCGELAEQRHRGDPLASVAPLQPTVL